MKPAHIEIHENEIIISNENRPIFILVSLVVLTIISLIIPIVATAIVLNEGYGLKFGLLISYLVGWGVALFFIRLILWNVFGKEVFQIKNNSIEYYCSYKYFVDNHIILSLENIEIYTTQNEEATASTLTIKDLNKVIETSHTIAYHDIELIKNKIKKAD